MEWRQNTSQIYMFIKDVSTTSLGINFPRPVMIKFNHLRPEFVYSAQKCSNGNEFYDGCECGTKEQTAEHVITSCPIYHHSNGTRAFSNIDKSLVIRLKNYVRPFSGLSSFYPSPLNEEEEEDYFLGMKIKKFEADSK